MTKQELIDMPLHTTKMINNTGIFVFRVMDGWIYQFGETSNCFVPEPQLFIEVEYPKTGISHL